MQLNLAILPGDGIGPEIVEVALNVTKAVAKKFGHTLSYEYALVGACAIDKTGSPYPDETHVAGARRQLFLQRLPHPRGFIRLRNNGKAFVGKHRFDVVCSQQFLRKSFTEIGIENCRQQAFKRFIVTKNNH